MSATESLVSKFSDVIRSKKIFAPEDAYMEHVEIKQNIGAISN